MRSASVMAADSLADRRDIRKSVPCRRR
jgi:hypothetical protein